MRLFHNSLSDPLERWTFQRIKSQRMRSYCIKNMLIVNINAVIVSESAMDTINLANFPYCIQNIIVVRTTLGKLYLLVCYSLSN
jgi:hypothetical protein